MTEKSYTKIFSGKPEFQEAKKKVLDSSILEKYLKDNRYSVDKKFIPALAELIMKEDLSMDDISNVSRGDYGYGQIISFGRNGPDWWFVSDKDATAAFQENQKSFIDVLGLENISNIKDFIDIKKAEKYFRNVYTEWDYSYAEDIANESSTDPEFENRLEQEMADWGAKNLDDFVKKMVNDKINYGNGGYDSFVLDFGEGQARDILIKENLFDVNKYINYVMKYDGRGPSLSGYDGEEHEYKGVCYYRTN